MRPDWWIIRDGARNWVYDSLRLPGRRRTDVIIASLEARVEALEERLGRA
jgi:hypothetical protein